jgi:hypothetical protein
VIVVVVMFSAHAAISTLIAFLVRLQAITMPVAGIRVHRAIMLRGIHPVLVSRLVGALALGILGILIVSIAVPTSNAVISRLITLLVEIHPVAMPVVGAIVHWSIIAGGVHAILISRLVSALIFIDLLSLHDHWTQQDRRYTQRYVESETSELLLYHHFLNSPLWLPGENFRKRMTLFDA